MVCVCSDSSNRDINAENALEHFQVLCRLCPVAGFARIRTLWGRKYADIRYEKSENALN